MNFPSRKPFCFFSLTELFMYNCLKSNTHALSMCCTMKSITSPRRRCLGISRGVTGIRRSGTNDSPSFTFVELRPLNGASNLRMFSTAASQWNPASNWELDSSSAISSDTNNKNFTASERQKMNRFLERCPLAFQLHSMSQRESLEDTKTFWIVSGILVRNG